MQRNFKPLDLRNQIPEGTSKHFSIWKNLFFNRAKRKFEAKSQTGNAVLHFTSFKSELAISGQHPCSSSSSVSNQKGFVQILMISLLPVILSGLLVILFTQFISKNWMQSLHICRTNLLSAQKKTRTHLKRLMDLNALAKSLRLALKMAQAELAFAIATENPGSAAKATADIMRIQEQRKRLDLLQKSLIVRANLEMNNGLRKTVSELNLQSFQLQSRLPDLFDFRIHSIQTTPNTLAVQPDMPDVAPVYELKKPFTESQALSVSWISEFRTKNHQRYQWIQNSHKKKDSCTASLFSAKENFSEGLTEDRSFWKP
jgi:hypothetical protein